MPIEFSLLLRKPVKLTNCPRCGEPFEPFLRGQVQRTKRSWFGLGRRRPYCALICWACKEIVGYEDPEGGFERTVGD